MRTVRTRYILTALAALALVLPSSQTTDAQSKGTIKIATQSPLSGGQAALGEGIKVRRCGLWIAIRAETIGSKRIGDDQHDIRTALRAPPHRGRGGREP